MQGPSKPPATLTTKRISKTRDIPHFQQVLGHRDLRNTLIYINHEKALFQNVDDQFHVKVAQTLDEATKLLEYDGDHVILVREVVHAEAEENLEQCNPLLHDSGE